MGKITSAIVFIFLLFSITSIVSAQNVFSEQELAYRKTLLPYDVPYTFPIGNNEFVMLSESKKNVMKLGRYDQLFFEKWEKEVDFNPTRIVPQIFVKGDSVITYSFTFLADQQQSQLTFRYFNLESGEESAPSNYEFDVIEGEALAPRLTFNESRTKFVIYNRLVNLNNTRKAEFKIFEIGSLTPLNTYHLEFEKLASPRFNAVHLAEDGDLFLAVASPVDFKLETYFWSSKNQEMNQVSSNFFFERPVERIGEINIVRQGASSYFLSFSAMIEEDLIGFNVTGVNVVLKNIMFTHNQNFKSDELHSIYEDYYVTSTQQKQKSLAIPETLEQFRLVKSIVNSENDILLLFEQLEKPSEFHEKSVSTNMSWKFKVDEDKFYAGGDLILYCFTAGGDIKWKKVIQKTQYSQANTLGLSFISRMVKDELRLLMYESTKGGNFYVLDINSKNGALTKSTNLLPNSKLEFTKKYSCWLSDQSAIICTIAPTNINKRVLKLIEFK